MSSVAAPTFDSLPPEIRLHIYEYVLKFSPRYGFRNSSFGKEFFYRHYIYTCPDRCEDRAFPHLYDDSDDSDDDDDLLPSDFEEKVICPPILLVSRQTYTEAISLFYGGNTFRFNLCLSVDNDAFSLKRRHLCRMQGVDLEIDRLTGAEGEELCDLAAGLIKEANARPHRKGALAVEFKNFITIQDYEGELLETIKAVTQVEQVFLVLSDYRSKLAQAFYERTGPLWELKAILEEAFDVVTKESRTGEWPHRLVFAFTFGSEQKARSQF